MHTDKLTPTHRQANKQRHKQQNTHTHTNTQTNKYVTKQTNTHARARTYTRNVHANEPPTHTPTTTDTHKQTHKHIKHAQTHNMSQTNNSSLVARACKQSNQEFMYAPYTISIEKKKGRRQRRKPLNSCNDCIYRFQRQNHSICFCGSICRG